MLTVKLLSIPGASTGIGLATAHLFAQRGARLTLIARSAGKLERLAAELPDAFPAPADLTDIPAIPGLTASTEFTANAHSVEGRPDWRSKASLGDPVEHVAEKIFESVQTEPAETYANSSRPRE